MKRVLVTGSRVWTNVALLHYAIDRHMRPGDVLIQGNAIGPDQWSKEYWSGRGPVEGYDADWGTYGDRAGMIRNAQMLDTGVDLVLAFPHGKAKGTRGCMRLAASRYIPVIWYHHETGAAHPLPLQQRLFP